MRAALLAALIAVSITAFAPAHAQQGWIKRSIASSNEAMGIKKPYCPPKGKGHTKRTTAAKQ
jgi:hypothetical protein